MAKKIKNTPFGNVEVEVEEPAQAASTQPTVPTPPDEAKEGETVTPSWQEASKAKDLAVAELQKTVDTLLDKLEALEKENMELKQGILKDAYADVSKILAAKMEEDKMGAIKLFSSFADRVKQFENTRSLWHTAVHLIVNDALRFIKG